MRKTYTISVRVDATTKAAAERAAAADHRSLSSLLEKLLTAHLREHGYLSKEG